MLRPQLTKIERSLKMPLAFMGFFDIVYIILALVLFPGKYLKTNEFSVEPAIWKYYMLFFGFDNLRFLGYLPIC